LTRIREALRRSRRRVKHTRKPVKKSAGGKGHRKIKMDKKGGRGGDLNLWEKRATRNFQQIHILKKHPKKKTRKKKSKRDGEKRPAIKQKKRSYEKGKMRGRKTPGRSGYSKKDKNRTGKECSRDTKT